jgi:hypothetical protein
VRYNFFLFANEVGPTLHAPLSLLSLTPVDGRLSAHAKVLARGGISRRIPYVRNFGIYGEREAIADRMPCVAAKLFSL